MDWKPQREEMVAHLASRGITNPSLLAVFRAVPREPFVPEILRAHSYEDRALPIGRGQTISQPYMIALLLNALNLRPTDKVLEVGTGSGYEAALLARLARQVHTVEIDTALASQAERVLALNNSSAIVHVGDGSQGWPASAPYDAILVAAAAPAVPPPLRVQLKPGGRLVIPIQKEKSTELVLVEWKDGCWSEKEIGSCAFVPLQGRYGVST